MFGLAAAATFVLGAWMSGALSPLARRPILDGAATLPYRWVSPPPDLASTNKVKTQADHSLLTAMAQAPSANGHFEVATTGRIPSPSPVGPGGSTAGPGDGGGGPAGGSFVPWVAVGGAVVVATGLVIARMRSRARRREYESYQRYRDDDAAPATRPPGDDAPSLGTEGETSHGKGAHRRRRRR
jgi:hypothetical protein